MNLKFTPHTLFFKYPFKIAHGVRDSTPIVITELEYNGVIGYGEASMPPYLGESHETVITFLKTAALLSKGFKDVFDTANIHCAIDEIAPGNSAAKASFDIALHDLQGKLIGKPVYEMLGLIPCDVLSTYTIGIDIPKVLEQKLQDATGFKMLKVKLGSDNDKEMISTIRNLTNKPIAIDVNQGWKDKHQALDMIGWLNDKNVLFIEQPLPKNNLDDMAWLTERSPILTIADESIQRLSDVRKIKGAFGGINMKLMKSTGIYEGKKIIEEAKAGGMKVLIGCMSETSCGISAAAQLSPLADWTDLDGAYLIKNDLFKGVPIVDGAIHLNSDPGIGAYKL